MYLALDVDSVMDEIWFDWNFQFIIIFFVLHGGMWSLVLQVDDEEWADVEWLSQEDMLKEVYWLCLCNEYELE